MRAQDTTLDLLSTELQEFFDPSASWLPRAALTHDTTTPIA